MLVCPAPDSRQNFAASLMGSGTGPESLTLVSSPWVQLGLPGLALKSRHPLGPESRALDGWGTTSPVVPRVGVAAAGALGSDQQRSERGVRFGSLFKLTGDAVRSASALRQGISCTIGGKSG